MPPCIALTTAGLWKYKYLVGTFFSHTMVDASLSVCTLPIVRNCFWGKFVRAGGAPSYYPCDIYGAVFYYKQAPRQPSTQKVSHNRTKGSVFFLCAAIGRNKSAKFTRHNLRTLGIHKKKKQKPRHEHNRTNNIDRPFRNEKKHTHTKLSRHVVTLFHSPSS